MNALAAYAGRTVDVVALRASAGTEVLTPSLFDSVSSGQIVTGVVKLAQRWAIRFLTVLGSMPFLPDDGSTFITAARVGRLRTEANVMTEFQFAAEQVRQQLSSETTPTTPGDEILNSATLTSIFLTDDAGLAIEVAILSMAGTSASIILPVSVSTLSTPTYAVP